ncbi:MAG: NAD(P)-dependent oxidoreductase [Clostridiales bacterium]|nr:NAD(P)-dependent oxidoreductase [Clostridiales bacterium]
MKKVIITGPTGAIGTALIRECVAQGMSVTAVCRRGSRRREYLKFSRLFPERNQSEDCSDILRPDRAPARSGDLRTCGSQDVSSGMFCVVECDLDELKDLPGLIGESGYDVFFHLGWAGTFGSERDQMHVQADNIQYTLDAVRAASLLGCRRFIGVGSQAEYGRTDQKLAPDTPAWPESGYGMAKLCAGQMSRALCEQLGIEHIWARVLSVYGPCDGKNTMIMTVIRSLLEGRKPALTKGEQLWDYLYSDDAAYALYLLSQNGVSGRVYPVGSGIARPLADYIRILRDCIDPALPLGFGEIEYGSRQVMHLCADSEALQKDTGFVPRYSFEEGIQRTILWCRGAE